ncbi:MAG: formylglycine-generating enzyme family protein [Bradymonadales bacterium]|nr:formylglycine-generating enzyme family protein [Bradymonadales bacterium]
MRNGPVFIILLSLLVAPGCGSEDDTPTDLQPREDATLVDLQPQEDATPADLQPQEDATPADLQPEEDATLADLQPEVDGATGDQQTGDVSEESTCTPDCSGLECGPDPLCGQECGPCDWGWICNEGDCVADTAIEWVAIAGGTYQMGDEEDDSSWNEPAHSVTVPTFELARTEVTVAQYRACVEAQACTEPDTSTDCNWGVDGRDRHPINCVTWHQARQYAEWTGGRLPSEAEWEYTARSQGQDIEYPWGDAALTCDHAVVSEDSTGTSCETTGTQPVCSKTIGHSDQGLCDLAGNVWEWTEDDWHGDYTGAPADGSAWVDIPRGTVRVMRGGGWDYPPRNARAARRDGDEPGISHYNCGLRPARSTSR